MTVERGAHLGPQTYQHARQCDRTDTTLDRPWTISDAIYETYSDAAEHQAKD